MGPLRTVPSGVVRARELTALLAAVGTAVDATDELVTGSSVASPAGGVALLHGEAGAGKSHLADTVAGAAREAGRPVARGDGFPHATAVPFGPFVDVTAELVELAGGPETACTLIGPTAWQVLARLDPGRVGPPPATGQLELPRLVTAFVDLLSGVCAARPLLLVLEDLHWADASSLGLVLRLARRPPAGCGVLLTWRDPVRRGTPLHDLLGELLRSPDARDVPLGPLTDDAVRALVTGARPGVSPAQVGYAVRHAAGNAFAALALAGSDDPGTPAVPSRLADVLLASTQQLGRPAQDALRVLAVAARPISWDVLGTATGLADAALQDAIDELALAGLLSTGSERLSLRHALLSDVVASAVPPGRRRALHHALADALLSQTDTEHTDAEVAGHLRAAGRMPEARAAALRAAREAAARCAYPEAVALFDLALSGPADSPPAAAPAPTLPTPPSTATGRVGLLLEAADVSRWAEATARGLAWVDEAAARCAGSPGLLAEVEHARGRVLWAHGDPQGSLDAYRRAVLALPPDAPDAQRARLTASLASGLMTTSRFAEALDTATRALALCGVSAGRLRDDQEVLDPVVQHALVTWGVCAAETGGLEAGLHALARARATALPVHDPDSVVRAYANSTFVLAHAGRWREAVRLADDGLVWGRGLGLAPAALPILINNRVSGLIALGDWPQARRAAADALSDAQAPPRGFRLALHLALAEVSAACGEDVDAALRPALELPGADTDPLLAVYAACARAEAALWNGAAKTARDLVAAGLAVAAATGLPHETVRLAALGLRAEADLAGGTGGSGRVAGRRAALERRDALSALVTGVARDANPGQANPELHAAVLAARAEACRLDDDPATEGAAWAEAQAAWTAVEQVYPAAYCGWRLALAEFARRRPEAGTGALKDAMRAADRLGARPLSEVCRLTARAAGVEDRLSGPDVVIELPPDDGWRLTTRERQVLELLSEGLSNRQVGRRLGISEKTVSVHLSNLYAKLGVTSRTEAVSVMIRSLRVDHS